MTDPLPSRRPSSGSPAKPRGSARGRRAASRIGLALAGGGPLGAIYEVGALCALEEALDGLDFTRLDGYVGVSAGAFIAAGLANAVSPRAMCTGFIENDGGPDDLVHPSIFVQPAWGEMLERLASVPALVAEATWGAVRGDTPALGVAERLASALPTGFFSNAPIEEHLRRLFDAPPDAPGRTDDFRALARRLVLVATDLDTGQVAPFGAPGWDDVPISRAITASAALPGLYPPVAIGGRHYVDGALRKTLHASVLLDEGIDLLLCINPLVPFNASHAPRHAVADGTRPIPHLVEGGLPLVASQAFRSMIHSRLVQGLQAYELQHPDVDIALFEPDHSDPELFVANTFSYAARRHLAEHAYQSTRADLRARRHELAPLFARHGIHLLDAVLDDPGRHLVRARGAGARGRSVRPAAPLAATLRRLDGVLDELQAALGTPGA
jgi:predicted acylesterase/phospholipase RssA